MESKTFAYFNKRMPSEVAEEVIGYVDPGMSKLASGSWSLVSAQTMVGTAAKKKDLSLVFWYIAHIPLYAGNMARMMIFLLQAVIASGDRVFIGKVLRIPAVELFLQQMKGKQTKSLTVHEILLAVAVYEGDIQVVTYLLNKGFPSPLKARFMDVAVLSGNLEMMERLYDPDCWGGSTILAHGATESAVRAGNLPALKWLRKHDCPWNEPLVINLALKQALFKKNRDIFVWLLSEGNARKIHPPTFMQIAIRGGYNTCKMAEGLLNMGWGVTYTSEHLLQAIPTGDQKLVAYLVEQQGLHVRVEHIQEAIRVEAELSLLSYLLSRSPSGISTEDYRLLSASAEGSPYQREIMGHFTISMGSPVRIHPGRKRKRSLGDDLFFEGHIPKLARRSPSSFLQKTGLCA
jgi:hypothetical protein